MEDIEVEYVPLWRSYRDLFRKARLSFEDIGILISAMIEYQFDGELKMELPYQLEIFWLFIERDLDNAKKKYEAAVKNGRKGGRPKKQKENPEETQQNPEESQQNPEKGMIMKRSRLMETSMSTKESMLTKESMSGKKKEQGPGHPAEAGESLSLSKKTYGEFGWVRLNDEEYRKLEQLLGADTLKRCITYIDESAQSTRNRNNWFDWYIVLRRCAQQKWYETKPMYPSKPEIPKGASGELGQAELEAIQKVLREG